MSVFSRFPPLLQHAIANHLGMTSLRPVQELAGEAILDGQNAVVLAPTAGGKTEASVFPVLAGLLAAPPSGVGALYVAPIKALLNNQEIRLGDYTQMVGLRRFVWHGDAAQSHKQAFCREPAEILMTTPESLEVMLMSPRVPASRLFEDLRCVIVDEIHAFAGTDRGAHLMSVIERIAILSRRDVQRIGLSATVGNPEHIGRWLAGTSARPTAVIDPPRPKAQRRIKIYLRQDVSDFAREAVGRARQERPFFCRSRALTEPSPTMRDDPSRSRPPRLGLGESARRRRSTLPRHERLHVATSTLEPESTSAASIHVQPTPCTVSSFLQRMGRTGRRPGTVANMTFLCEDAVSWCRARRSCAAARAGSSVRKRPRLARAGARSWR
jgi:ATP-dependent Lhr-like helicase